MIISTLRQSLLVVLIAAAPLAAATFAAAPLAEARAAEAPASFADLAEKVTPAVVNISASQVDEKSAQDDKSADKLDRPKNAPAPQMDDLFEEFLKRHRQRNGEGKPHRAASLGSGFVIDPSGVVITNNHVIDGANDIEVIFTDGTKLRAEIVGKDAKVDIAVLRIKPQKPLTAVAFGDSDKARVGDWVIAVGNPFALGGSVTAGIISAKGRNIDSGPYDSFLQTDAAINKGNSGGPLFNMAGEVIGINTAILSPSGGSIGIGFATPSSMAQPVIEQLLKFGETRRGWLGVRIQNVDEGIADSLGLKSAHGALISGVDDKGPSAHSGFKPGDVIVRFDGKEVSDARDLPKIVALTPVGKDVDVVVIREGAEQTKKVTLGQLEEGEARAKKDKPAPSSAPKLDKTHALGMDLTALSDDLRQKLRIKDSVKSGVAILAVDEGSAAAEQRLGPGDVILEVNRTPINAPQDFLTEIKKAKSNSKKTALLLVANVQGQARFVALALD